MSSRWNDFTQSITSAMLNDRIARITNSKRTSDDLWQSVHGPVATRESRMEVVAWLAVCKFYCTLTGGFIRDWIVGNTRSRPQPSILPSQWIKFKKIDSTPSLDKALVPHDLDCILPVDRFFDMERFQKEINAFQIVTRLFRSHVHFKLLLDEHAPTGPFTIDFVEPYSTVRFTVPDLDVNGLFLKRDHNLAIVPDIDLTCFSSLINLREIIENIERKQFRVLTSMNKYLSRRIDKMLARGWTQIGVPPTLIPNRIKLKLTVYPLFPTSSLYGKLNNEMQQIPGCSLVDIEAIHNQDIEVTYESMKQLVASQCPENDPNERFLFYAVHEKKVRKIIEEGFDYGFFRSQGLFGDGAYFADDPYISHQHTVHNNQDNLHIIFYNKVILGREMIMNMANRTLCAAPSDHHSVRGCTPPFSGYIVYRFTQILPILKVTYRTDGFIKSRL